MMLAVGRAWSGLIIAVRRCLRNVVRLMVIRDSGRMLVGVAGLWSEFGHWHGFRVVILKSRRVVLLERCGVNGWQGLLWHDWHVEAGLVVDMCLQRHDGGSNVVFMGLKDLVRLMVWSAGWSVRVSVDCGSWGRDLGLRQMMMMLDLNLVLRCLIVVLLIRNHDVSTKMKFKF